MPVGQKGFPKAFRNPELKGRFFGGVYITVETKGNERVLWRAGQNLGTVTKDGRHWRIADGRYFDSLDYAVGAILRQEKL